MREANEQRERAERSEDVKRRFLANMSHEIRTPMNAVTGMTSLVLDTELTEKQKGYLENIRVSADNLLQIINDILDYSKIEEGKMELEKVDFSISEVVEQVRRVVKYKADEKGIQSIMNIDPGVNDVLVGDPLRLNQILINLVGNGIKFTEKGSVSLVVRQHNDLIRFEVIDTGIGIPPNKLRFVFDSFNQANASDTRKYGGTGLGLSISQQLVQLMGGTIDLESKMDRGTTFSFEIMLPKGDEKKYRESLRSDKSIDTRALNGLKVLIADDNEFNRIIAREILQTKAKITVVEAENGAEAIEKIDNSFDLILMDGQMPVMNGFDATRKIRGFADEKVKGLPIIAFTASVLRSDLDKCFDSGMNGYIPKPFKQHELFYSIADALGIELEFAGTNDLQADKLARKSENKSVTDLTYLREYCDENKSRMNKYIHMFLNSAPEFLTELDNGITCSKSAELADHLHSFGTKIAMMGMNDTRSLIIEVENLLRSETDPADLHDKIQLIKNDVEKGINELSSIELD